MVGIRDYTFAVARIRAKENLLFTDNDISALMSLKSYDDCLNMLTERGWITDSYDYEKILYEQEKLLWSFIRELTDDMSEFNIFLYQKDFHNLKASIKAIVTDSSTNGIFYDTGSISAEKIYNSIKNKEYNQLPEYLKTCAENAMKVLLQTNDGQLCDIIIDKALLDEVRNLAENSRSEAIRLYADTLITTANIKTAVRCNKTGKSLDFIKNALVECNTLNKDFLAKASSVSIDEIYNYLLTTDYRNAVDALKKSLSAFEIWCDNKLTENMQPQKWEPFTIGPLVAYIVAKENEIKTVRILLSAKFNQLDEQIIKERLRKMYV